MRGPRGVRCVCVLSRHDPRKGIAAVAVVATGAAGTGEAVIGRVAVSTVAAAATGVTGDRRVTISAVTAAAAGGTINRRVTVSTVPAATAGVAVSAVVANVTDKAIGPAVAVNPGVSRCCTISGAVSTLTTATAGVTINRRRSVRATAAAVSPAPSQQLSRGRSSRRNCETHPNNRHRRILSTVPHDLVSCGNVPL